MVGIDCYIEEVSLSGKLTYRNSLCQLQVFEALARLLGLTRVAEELFLTQPTVSMQIKKLENDNGTSAIQEKSFCQSWQQGLSTSCTGRDHCC